MTLAKGFICTHQKINNIDLQNVIFGGRENEKIRNKSRKHHFLPRAGHLYRMFNPQRLVGF